MLTPLHEAGGRSGAKAATLARLLRAGFPVPAGFVIDDVLGDEDWPLQLAPALRALGGPFAVRSSASGEDGPRASFAGQLHTALGVVTATQVAREVRRCATSGSGPAAATYATRTGGALAPAVPVIVQRMLRPEVAGVLFTRHPLTGADQVVVEAARGLGDGVVGGTVTPQRWVVTGCTVDGPQAADGVTGSLLTSAQVLAVAGTGRRVEALLGSAQDVEWALSDGVVHVLQARPITTGTAGVTPPARGTVLLRGTPASPGTAHGTVRTVTGLDDFARFRAGDVLVCRTTSPAWTPLLARAAAVVTETGGVLAHAAIVAREFGVPAVVAAVGAGTVLTDGSQVTVDGTDGTVRSHPGAVP